MGLKDVGRGSGSLERPLKGQQAHIDSLPEGTTYRDITQTENRTASAVTHTILYGAGF